MNYLLRSSSYVTYIVLAFFIVTPVVFASQHGGGNANPATEGGGDANPPHFASSTGLVNPLDGISSITDFFLAILDILLVFAIPFVVFFIIYAGFMYVTARGDTGKIQTAHNALLYAIIGGLLILGARLILDVIAGTVDEFLSMSEYWLS